MDKFDRLKNLIEAHKANIAPAVKVIPEGQYIKNAKRTALDKPAVGDSWKEYWATYVFDDFPKKCPFCGEPLVDDDIDGCHVHIGFANPFVHGIDYEEAKYIIPGHHACNMQLGQEFRCQHRIKAVEAIES